MDPTTETARLQEAGSLFDEHYYRTGCGLPYERNDHWLTFFSKIAEEINRSIRPRRVFDAGCAMGMLVEAFWDRGVEAYGIDISSYAVSNVRRDMAPYCQIKSLVEPIEERFDLVTCIEVLEHMPESEARIAIKNMTKATDLILFSSTPSDFTEPTHINVHPTIYWLNLFSDYGFWPDLLFDGSFIAAHAILFRHRPLETCPPGDVLVLFSDILRLRSALVEREQRIGRLNAELALAAKAADREVEIAELRESLSRAESARDAAEEYVHREKAKHDQALFRVAETERNLRESQADYAMVNEKLNRAQAQLAEAQAEELELRNQAQEAALREQSLRATISEQSNEVGHRTSERDAFREELDQTRSQLVALEVEAKNLKYDTAYTRQALTEMVSSPGWQLILKYRKWLWSTHFSSRLVRRWCEPSARSLLRKRVSSKAEHTEWSAAPTSTVSLPPLRPPVRDLLTYQEWAGLAEPTPEQLFLQAQLAHQFSYSPKISVLAPVYKLPITILKEMVDSVRRQTYEQWELCIAHGDPGDQEARSYLASMCQADSRIKVVFLDANLGISGNSNEALRLCSGEFVALLDHDDTLAPFALFEVADLLNRQMELDFIYSDKDHLVENSEARAHPLFKPQWSPDVMLSANYLTHLCVIRTTAIHEAGGWRSETDGAQDWDLFLRILEHTSKIAHIPKVLYHWREIESSVAMRGLEAKPYAASAQLRALGDHLSRRGIAAAVSFTSSGLLRLKWAGERPSISIFIVTSSRDEFVLDESLRSTGCDLCEVFVVPADGAKTTLTPLGGNAKAPDKSEDTDLAGRLNSAVKRSSGEVLIFLDADIRPACAEWVDELAYPLRDSEIGVVGGKFFDPQTSAIRHAGIAFNPDGSLQYPFESEHDYFWGQFGGANWYRNWLAVSGACFSTRRDVFLRVGGFSQQPSCQRIDIDFCLKVILDLRLRVLYNPFVRMWQNRLAVLEQWTGMDEAACSRYVLDNFPDGDPYCNPNLICHLGDLALRAPKAVGRGSDHNFAGESRTLVKYFDCTPGDVKASLRASTGKPSKRHKRLTWFIPQFDNPFYGGIHTILRFAAYFQRAHQVESTFTVLGHRRQDRIAAQIARVSETLANSSEINVVSDYGGLAKTSASDAAIATLWSTAYYLLRFNDTGQKFYFLQDYEPLFYPAGSTSALVEATYRFGFHGICNTPGVRDLYLHHGGTADYFEPCVDTDVFHGPVRKRTAPPYILFCYARPGHSRNCFELLGEGLRKLKRRMGEKVVILTAGEAWDAASFDLQDIVQSLGLLDYRTTGAIYRMSHAGVTMMMTCHPSYLPLELMACGSLVVTNRNEHTQWLLRDRENCLLTGTTPSAIAETLEEGLRDDVLRDRITQDAAAMVERKYQGWEEQAEKVFRYIYPSL